MCGEGYTSIEAEENAHGSPTIYVSKMRRSGSAMIVIVMGVVGSGKTLVGHLLAQELGLEFADADDFHSPANVEKIRNGVALTDEDRKPWLDCLRAHLLSWQKDARNGVMACSALKQSYRDELTVGPEVRFVYLKGSPELIRQRLRSRHGHFADDKILASQFADLEEPQSAVVIDIDQTPAKIVAEIREALCL